MPGYSKFMYHHHAFSEAQLTWDDLLVEGRDTLSTIAEATLWLRESIAVLDDAELLRPRMTNWGELKETRWIIAVMIEHGLYHAGEINHLRALH